MSNLVRVRFAPSPTGMLHIGAVRTALFAWLYARQNKGMFILRIEDTDKEREVPGAVKNIQDSLDWLGLKWDEGPYLQSEHLSIYREHAEALLEKGLAYADTLTPQDVQKFRDQSKLEGRPFLFRDYRPENPPKWDGKLPLRFKVPKPKSYQWNDAVRGKLQAGSEALDDIVLIKSDGYPTYNFAHIVDDYLMKITHVFRGEEFIASVPKYLSIYEALGWQPPEFVTVPIILGTDGTKKLSKRAGAQSLLDYKIQGYLPEAINNFLALLGWNDGTTQEIFSMDELIKKFSIERIQKSPAKFDIERLNWISTHHIRQLSVEQLAKQAVSFWPSQAKNTDDGLKRRILEVEQERIKKFADISELPSYFFSPPDVSEQAHRLNREFEENIKDISANDWLKEIVGIIEKVGDSDRTKLEAAIRKAVGSHDGKPGALFTILRIVLSNYDKTPPIWDIVYILGKEESAKRIDTAIKQL